MDADVVRVAHQEQRRQRTHQVRQSCQARAHAHRQLGTPVTDATQRNKVFELVGSFGVGEGSERKLVMDVMLLTTRFQFTAGLAGMLVAFPHLLAQLVPAGSVLVAVVAPGAHRAQLLDRIVFQHQPIAHGGQFAGRQVHLARAELLVGVPADLLITGHLGGDDQLAVGARAARAAFLLDHRMALYRGAGDRIGIIIPGKWA